MIRLIATLAFILSFCQAAAAQQIIADLNQSRVSIDTRFSGSEILVFGAVRPDPQGSTKSSNAEPLDVIVTVSGPKRPVTVRKKARVAGIWINSESMHVDAAPTFYSVASTRPLKEILSNTDDLRHGISIDRAIRSVGATDDVDTPAAFLDALIRIRKDKGLYDVRPEGVQLEQQTLFRANIALPSSIVEGNYRARIFLVRDKHVVADFDKTINVRKVGLERWIYHMAQQQALIYSLLSLLVAIVASWGITTLFRVIRN